MYVHICREQAHKHTRAHTRTYIYKKSIKIVQEIQRKKRAESPPQKIKQNKMKTEEGNAPTRPGLLPSLPPSPYLPLFRHTALLLLLRLSPTQQQKHIQKTADAKDNEAGRSS